MSIAGKERKSLTPYPLGTYSILLTLPLGLIQTPLQAIEIIPLRSTLFKPSFIWQTGERGERQRGQVKKYICMIVGSKP